MPPEKNPSQKAHPGEGLCNAPLTRLLRERGEKPAPQTRRSGPAPPVAPREEPGRPEEKLGSEERARPHGVRPFGVKISQLSRSNSEVPNDKLQNCRRTRILQFLFFDLEDSMTLPSKKEKRKTLVGRLVRRFPIAQTD